MVGGASCQSGGACFKPPPPLAAARACAVARRRARESGATNCPPARLPASAARTLIFVVGIGKWRRRPCQPASLEIVQATYCDFRRGDREVETAETATLSTWKIGADSTRKASLEIVRATYCDFRRGNREVETATLST